MSTGAPPPRRPPWWPADEPWPPAGPPWRRGRWRGRFVWRFGAFLLLALFLISSVMSIAFWLVSAAFGRFGGPGYEPYWIFRPGLFFLLAGIVALALLFRSIRSTAAPFDDLIDAARHIEQGDYSRRVREQGPREVRALARAFNAMSANLEASSAQRRSFLADVTHELRTPLTVIQGNVEGIIDGVYPASPETLGGILDETRVLTRLVDDLRTLALTESGALTLRLEPTDLGSLTGEVVGGFRARAVAAGVGLEVEIEENLPRLDLDPARVREVLENLLSNALHYTPRGGSIIVSARRAQDSQVGNAVVLSVQDSGRGIAPDAVAQVFERFYRAPESHGSGLGLPIVKDLVEAHGGRVSLMSTIGKGTRIECVFPE